MTAPRKYPRVRAVKSIADALSSFLDKRGADEEFHLGRLWEHWEMVLGPELASLSVPLGRRRDTLLVGAEDPMAAQELAMQTGEILERVNAFMDRPFFSRVQVEQIMGRNDLSRMTAPTPMGRGENPILPRPEKLGELVPTCSTDSAIDRCYRAYLRYFQRHNS